MGSVFLVSGDWIEFKALVNNLFLSQFKTHIKTITYLMMVWYEFFLKHGLFPDELLRLAIRYKLSSRLKSDPRLPSEIYSYLTELQRKLDASPIAIKTNDANEQHYEVPPEFFKLVLGKHLKYSSCYWGDISDVSGDPQQLDLAEIKMLDLTIQRAEIKNGMEILDLGCGWGSLSLYMAEKYPGCSITAFSYSKDQKLYIEEQVKLKGLSNISVITADIATHEFKQEFDLIVSVEMFEHMRNYKALFSKLAAVLRDQGVLFVHIFARKGVPYLFDSSQADNWMAKYFFSGGTMPDEKLLPNSAVDYILENEWKMNGRHYQKTLETWLLNMDRKKSEIIPIFRQTYGDYYKKWWNYWRVFFIVCAELFGFSRGDEWFVKHYRFVKK